MPITPVIAIEIDKDNFDFYQNNLNQLPLDQDFIQHLTEHISDAINTYLNINDNNDENNENNENEFRCDKCNHDCYCAKGLLKHRFYCFTCGELRCEQDHGDYTSPYLSPSDWDKLDILRPKHNNIQIYCCYCD